MVYRTTGSKQQLRVQVRPVAPLLCVVLSLSHPIFCHLCYPFNKAIKAKQIYLKQSISLTLKSSSYWNIQGVPKKCIHTLAADNSFVCFSLQIRPIGINDGSQNKLWKKEIHSKMLLEVWKSSWSAKTIYRTNRWIGRRGFVEYPPRSPELTPIDFFFYGDT